MGAAKDAIIPKTQTPDVESAVAIGNTCDDYRCLRRRRPDGHLGPGPSRHHSPCPCGDHSPGGSRGDHSARGPGRDRGPSRCTTTNPNNPGARSSARI